MSKLPPSDDTQARGAASRRRVVLGAATALAMAPATRRVPAETAPPPALRVVIDAHASPICFVDGQGRPRGLAVDLLQHLADRAGEKIELIVGMARADALQVFRRRGAALLIDGVPTDLRRGDALFTRPYQALTSVLVSRLMGRHYGSLAECRGARLALVEAHDRTGMLRRRHAGILLLALPTQAGVLQAVAQGRADAGLVASELVQRALQREHAGALAITALLPELGWELSFVLQPDLPVLRDALDTGLAEVNAPWLAAMRERWFGAAEGGAGGGMPTWNHLLQAASPLLIAAGGAALGSAWWISRLRREVQRRREAERGIAASRDHAADAARQRQRFIAFLSHEARGLVAGMSGGLELLAQSPDEALRQRLFDGLRANAAGLGQLLDASLDAAAIDAGTLSVALQPVQLRCLFERLRHEAAALARLRGLTLEVCDPGADTRVQADPVRLAQALRNVVFNGLKFTDRGGVRVLAKLLPGDRAGRVRIEVRDSGRGIAAEDLARLFKPYARVGDDLSAVPGTGLGLVISHELVQRMGGTLTVSSELGQGSCFAIELAAADAPGGAGAAGSAPSPAQPASCGPEPALSSA